MLKSFCGLVIIVGLWGIEAAENYEYHIIKVAKIPVNKVNSTALNYGSDDQRILFFNKFQQQQQQATTAAPTLTGTITGTLTGTGTSPITTGTITGTGTNTGTGTITGTTPTGTGTGTVTGTGTGTGTPILTNRFPLVNRVPAFGGFGGYRPWLRRSDTKLVAGKGPKVDSNKNRRRVKNKGSNKNKRNQNLFGADKVKIVGMNKLKRAPIKVYHRRIVKGPTRVYLHE